MPSSSSRGTSGSAWWTASVVVKLSTATVLALFAVCAAAAYVSLREVSLQQTRFEANSQLCVDGQAPQSTVATLSDQTGRILTRCGCATHAANQSETQLDFNSVSPNNLLILGWLKNSARLSAEGSAKIDAAFQAGEFSLNLTSTVRTEPAFRASCAAIQAPIELSAILTSSSPNVSLKLLDSSSIPNGVQAGAWLCEASSQAHRDVEPSAASLWDALEAPQCIARRRVFDVLVDAATLAVSLLGTYLSVVKREHMTNVRSRGARTARAQAVDRGASRYIRAVGNLRSKPALLFSIAMLLGNTVLAGLTFGKLLLLPATCAPMSHTAQWNEWINIGSSSALLTPLAGIGLGIAALPAHFNESDLLSSMSGAVAGVLVGVVALMLLPHLVMGAVLFVGIWIFNALLILLGLLLLACLLTLLFLAVRACVQAARGRRKAAQAPPPENTSRHNSDTNATPGWALAQRILMGLSGMSVLVWVAALPQLTAVVLRFGEQDSLCTDVGGSIEGAYGEAFPWDWGPEVFDNNPLDQLVSVNVGLSAIFTALSQNAHLVVAAVVVLLAAIAAVCAKRRGRAADHANGDEGGKGGASPKSSAEESTAVAPQALLGVVNEPDAVELTQVGVDSVDNESTGEGGPTGEEATTGEGGPTGEEATTGEGGSDDTEEMDTQQQSVHVPLSAFDTAAAPADSTAGDTVGSTTASSDGLGSDQGAHVDHTAAVDETELNGSLGNTTAAESTSSGAVTGAAGAHPSMEAEVEQNGPAGAETTSSSPV